MWIINLKQNGNGSHNDNNCSAITDVPPGWARIPEGFEVPETFPFVNIEAEEKVYTREVEVEKEVTRTMPAPTEEKDEDGNPVMKDAEYTTTEKVKELREITEMTVTKMTAGVKPEPEPEPLTQLDFVEAQVAYTAMMTDTLLEG